MSQSIHRALRVLEVLVASAPDEALGRLAKKAELSSPTTYRILQALVADGYAMALEGGRYRPGPKILALAGQVMTSMDYSVAARTALLKLQEFTPETVHFGVLSGSHAQYADKIEGRRPYRLASVLGMTLALHSTSIGKVILAFLGEEHARRLLDAEELVAHTPRTITNIDQLMQELQSVRKQGFSIDDEEDREGIRCLAAPVYDQVGAVMGGVSVSAPAVHLSFSQAIALAPRVIDAANDVSRALGAPSSVFTNANGTAARISDT